MGSLKDLWDDKAVRYLLIWSFVIASGLIMPYLLSADGFTLKTLWTYLKEIGFAVFVAIPILITIELFNQKRHKLLEKQELKAQAISLVKKDVPDEIWDVIDSSVIESSFYRTDFSVKYVLMLNQDKDGAEYVDVQITICYKAKRMRSGGELLPVSASLELSNDYAEKTKFTSFKVGTLRYTEEQLAAMVQVENGNLVVKGIPEQDVQKNSSLTVVVEMETAFVLQNPFEAFIMAMPATGLTIQVEASKDLHVLLDTLHSNDMEEVSNQREPNKYKWIQNSGLVTGQGAIIRWKKKLAGS